MLLEKDRMYQGSLILVNQKYPVKYQISEADLCPVFSNQPEVLMERESAGILTKLLEELQNEPEIQSEPEIQKKPEIENEPEIQRKYIVGVSGYRTMKEQIAIFNDSLKENGKEFTKKYVAFPGHSEHQTGLAMDLAENKPEIDFIRPDFPYEGICRKFREKAAAFGFIQRYTKEKQEITGISEEPWHFRYVGVPHAELIQEKGMALEEYIEWLKQFSITKPLLLKREGEEIRIGYVKAQGEITELEIPESVEKEYQNGNAEIQKGNTEQEIPEFVKKEIQAEFVEAQRENTNGSGHHIEISGNNMDGFIITDVRLLPEVEQRKAVYPNSKKEIPENVHETGRDSYETE